MNKAARFFAFMTVIVLIFALIAVPALAEEADVVTVGAAEESSEAADDGSAVRAVSAAALVGLAASVGAGGMTFAIVKAIDGITRNPEAESKIRTTLMLGLVFVETAIIYALVVAILIVFVL